MRKYFNLILLFLFFSSTQYLFAQGGQQPSLSVTGDKSICVGSSLVISVNNLQGGTYSFQWLKDGQSISGATASTYTATLAGVYTTEIKQGNNPTETIGTVTLTLNPPPNADFSFTPTSGCGKTTVSFSNLSDNGAPGQTSNLKYSWNFGNGKTSSRANPDPVRYSPPPGSGSFTYTITLAIENEQTGCVDTIKKTFSLGRGSDASLTSDAQLTSFNNGDYFTICTSDATASMNFSNTSTVLNTSYEIDWGDNSTKYVNSTFTTLSHVYSVGIYKLTLIAKGGACNDTTQYNIFVGSNPILGIISPGNTKICTGENLVFTLSTINQQGQDNPPGTIYKFVVNDGRDTLTLNHPLPATITINFPKSSCGVIGDFQSLTDSYKLEAIAENPCGYTPFAVRAIYVSQKPEPDFSILPSSSICINSSVKLKFTGKRGENILQNSVLGDCGSGKYYWTISPSTGWSAVGLGSSVGSSNQNDWIQGDAEINPVFSQAGIYTVTLVGGSPLSTGGTNTQCGNQTITKTIYVNPLPTGSFTLDRIEGCGPLVVQANGSTNQATFGNNTFNWTVAYSPSIAQGCSLLPTSFQYLNGTNSSSQNPTFQFDNPGTYTVTLQTFAPGGGCSSGPIVQTIIVRAKPVVTLSGIPSSICEGGSITPSASASCYIDGSTTYLWSFPTGSPTSSTTLVPGTISFPSAGTPVISLAVTNQCGTSTATQNLSVIAKPAVSAISSPSDAVCVGSTLNLTNTTTGGTWSIAPTSVATINSAGVVTGVSAGTATVTYAVSVSGCSNFVTKLITVNPKPVFTIAGATSVCTGFSTELGVNVTQNGTGASFLWSPNGQTSQSITLTPLSNTAVSVTVTNSNGCSSFNSTTVAVNSLPTISVTPANPSVCLGKSITLTASGALSYTWTATTITTTLTTSAITVSPQTTTTYYITGSNGAGCQNSSSITVVVNSLPIVSVGSATICQGERVTLTASGANTFSWSPSTGLNQFTGSTVQASPASTITYTVTGTDGNGCSSTATSVVSVNPLPPLTVNSPTICPNSSIELKAEGADTYTWANNSTLSALTGPIVTANPSSTTTYFVTGVFTSSGCSKTINSVVTIRSIPAISATPSNPSNCLGSDGFITISGLSALQSYTASYDFNGSTITKVVTTDNAGNAKLTGLSSGIYDRIFISQFGCNSNQIGPYTLTDPSNPAAPTISNVARICSGQNLIISLSSSITGATYYWSGPDNFTRSGVGLTSVNITSATVSATGIYNVYVVDKNCQSNSSSVSVTVDPTPGLPGVTSPLTYCQFESVPQLTATNEVGSTLRWYSVASGGSFTTTAPTPSTQNVGILNFYVSQINQFSCESGRANISVNVQTTPSILDQNLNICSGQELRPTFSSAPAGSVYSWTISAITPLNAITGATSQGSYVASFSQVLSNSTSSNATVTYVVSPKIGSCVGSDFNLVAVVKPIPVVTNADLAAICSGTSFSFTPSASVSGNVIPASMTLTWPVPVVTPLNALSGQSGNTGTPLPIISQTLTNLTNTPATITYTATPIANGCSGTAFTVSLRVDPRPKIQDVTKIICSDNEFDATPVNDQPTTIVTSGTLYTWPTPIVLGTNSTAITGGTAQLTGLGSIRQRLINTTTSIQFIRYVITPIDGVCLGNPFTVTVQVNPQPSIAPKSITICGGEFFSITPSDAPIGTLYTWSAPTIDPAGFITGASLQSTPVPAISQLLTNTRNTQAKVTYAVSPTSGACGGGSFIVEVIVNPKPFIPTLKDTICTGGSFILSPQDNQNGSIVPAQTTYTWALPVSSPSGAVTGGTLNSQATSTISQQLFNTSNAPGNLSYKVLPKSGSNSGGCAGDLFDVIIRVNPDAKAEFNPLRTIDCPPFLINGALVGLVQYPQRNSEYTWFVDNNLLGSELGQPNYSIIKNDDTITLKLITTSQYGCKPDSVSKEFATYKLPEPEFTALPNEGCGPLKVGFVNNTPDKSFFSYSWDFGNGIKSQLPDPDSILYFSNPSFEDTIYRVKLSTTSRCNVEVREQNVLVKARPKTVFSPSSTNGCSPFKVTFSNNSRGKNNWYIWRFADGRIDTLLDKSPISHTYYTLTRDTFRVELVSINDCGRDSAYFDIIVSPNTIRLGLAINGTEKEGCVRHTVNFINGSSGASAFRWDFGDGNIVSTNKNLDTVAHTYLQPGKYMVTLFATNGCTDTSTTTEVIVYGLPNPDFAVNKFISCVGDSVFFENRSKGADSYLWRLGDGKNLNFVDPGHRYAKSGIYSVKLIAFKTNSPGIVCSDSVERVINIVDTVQVFFATSDSITDCAPFPVSFKNFYKENIYAEWDFGDGSPKKRGDSLKHVYDRTGIFNSKLYVKGSAGCNYVGEKIIAVNSPTGTVNYKSSYSCFGENLRFEAIPFATDSIIWDFDDGTIIRTKDRVVNHIYSNPGKYVPKFKFLSSKGCTYEVAVQDTIYVDRIEAGFISTQEEFCGYTNLVFTDTSSYYFGRSSISWRFGDGIDQGFSFKQTHAYKATNTYLVEAIITGKSGCKDTVSVNVPVFVRSIPSIQIKGKLNICSGDSLVLESLAASQDKIILEKWVGPAGFVRNGKEIRRIYTQSGTYPYQFIVGTEYGCYDTLNFNVVVSDKPVVDAGVDFLICKGKSLAVNVKGADTYEWFPSEGLSCDNCPNPIVRPLTSSKYIIKGTNTSGCYSYDTLNVTVIPDFKLTISQPDSICIGDSVQLLVSGAKYYEWSPAATLSADNVQNPIAKPKLTTVYSVVGFDEYGCFRETATVKISVSEYPTLDLGPDKLLATGSLFPLKPKFTQGPIKTWVWTPVKDLNCSNCPEPIVRIRNQITYSAIATNYFGCSATDSITFKVFCENSQVYIPNAFTPDGDGLNDIFTIRASGIQQVKSFRVFNRWGELVHDKSNFQPNDPSFGWDGRVRGVVLQPDVFVYTVEVICDDGTPYFYKGNVSLLK